MIPIMVIMLWVFLMAEPCLKRIAPVFGMAIMRIFS